MTLWGHPPTTLGCQFVKGDPSRFESIIDQLFDAFILNCTWVKTPGQFQIDLPIGLALPAFNRWNNYAQGRPPGSETLLLRKSRCRKHNICHGHACRVVEG